MSKRRPIYGPRVCFACDAAGCERCGDSGYIIGPDATPATDADLGAPELNYRAIARKAA